MALMFQRLARNFVRKGYFPTDAETTSRILGALAPPTSGNLRILDPCCGEGVAIAELKHHLDAERTQAFGIEYDEDRAWHSKSLLDTVIHGDMQDCVLGQRNFGLLFLNPPYGDLVADKAQTGEATDVRRLELLFYQRTVSALQYGGVLVLIVPRYAINKTLSRWIAGGFNNVRVFEAADQQFKQIVLFGVRCRQSDVRDADETRRHLFAIGRKHLQQDVQRAAIDVQPLPKDWPHEPYTVPASTAGTTKFAYLQLEPRQLRDETKHHPCLWQRFEMTFAQVIQKPRRPLRALSDWHLALALAAGQISGAVRASDGRVYVIKGDTFKDKAVTEHYEEDAKGEPRRIVVKTDRFIPVIRALDFTPGSPTFGDTLVIR